MEKYLHQVPFLRRNLTSISDETLLIHVSILVLVLVFFALYHVNCSSEYISEMGMKASALTVQRVGYKIRYQI